MQGQEFIDIQVEYSMPELLTIKIIRSGRQQSEQDSGFVIKSSHVRKYLLHDKYCVSNLKMILMGQLSLSCFYTN